MAPLPQSFGCSIINWDQPKDWLIDWLFLYLMWGQDPSPLPSAFLWQMKPPDHPQPWTEHLLTLQGGREGRLCNGDSWNVPKAP